MIPDENDARARIGAVVDGELELLRRETSWLAMTGDVVARAADDDTGWQRLEREAWLIERWRAAGIPVPRVVRHDERRRVQVLERMHGHTGLAIHSEEETSPLFLGPVPDARARLDDAPLSVFGERLAASYGEIAARIRRAVSVEDAVVAGFGHTSHRTLDLDEALRRVDASGVTSAAKSAAHRAREWLAAVPPPDAVIHSDLHFFNMCTADDGTIIGLFDFGDSGLDAAATELLYVHSLGSRFVATVVDAYGPIDLEHVRRAHLRAALEHLIWHGPGTPRHESIVGWVSAAFERLVG